jgi:hypothetical protein
VGKTQILRRIIRENIIVRIVIEQSARKVQKKLDEQGSPLDDPQGRRGRAGSNEVEGFFEWIRLTTGEVR